MTTTFKRCDALIAWSFIPACILALLVWGLMSPPLRAQEATNLRGTADDRLEILADSATYEPEEDRYIAEGHVEIRYRGRTLKADRIVYDEAAGRVTATGGVTLIDVTGTRLTADNMALTDDLRDGFIEGVRALFSDGSRLAARQARRIGGERNTLSYAVYSPCKICEGEEPLWQIKAAKVVHDEEKRTLTYKHALLEIKGVPIFYVPYFQHPDPTVKRKTGLLVPKLSTDSQLGIGVQIPFYWAPADHRDFTIAPKWTTDAGLIMFGEYREDVGIGQHKMTGSITRPIGRDVNNEPTGERELRGHVFGEARYQIASEWRAGFDVGWASDDTYLRRYDISRADTLTNNIFVDRLADRTYIAVNAYTFQGLRRDDVQDRIPIVMPMIDFQHRSNRGWLGNRWRVDGNLLLLHRIDGLDMYRLSGSGAWELPYTSPSGQIFRLTLQARGDLYITRDAPAVPAQDNGLRDQGTELTGRAAPHLAVDWRWPFIRSGGRFQHIVEPIAGLVVAPKDNNPGAIPNEDSIDLEFSHLTLFQHDRSPGLDRVEDGTRLNYGMKYRMVTAAGAQASIMIGQSWRLTGQPPFPARSGLDDDLSDIVAGIDLHIPGLADLRHSMRFDESDGSVEKNQVELWMGPPSLRVALGYIDLGPQGFDDSLPAREEASARARVKLSDTWRVRGHVIQNFDQEIGTIEWGLGFTYEGSCLRLDTSVRRSFTRDRDVRPTTTFLFNISLLHLG